MARQMNGFSSRKHPDFKERHRAYNIYLRQVRRCENQKDHSFRWYGAKGIKVEYSVYDFVAWWMENIKIKKLCRPNCGRIDHSKNYSLNNIEMQEQSENSKESTIRNKSRPPPRPKKKIVLLDSKGNPGIIFESTTSAQKYLGLGNITRVCKGLQRADCGFRFKYYEDCNVIL